jgi:hypothetical protein
MTYTLTGSFVPRGKAIFLGLTALFAQAVPAYADSVPQTKGVCIHADEIDHTQVLNDHQVLFYLRGNKIWLNTLQGSCSTLPIEEGFAMMSDFSQFCANAQTIRVVNTRQVCSLGEFTPYEKPVGHS